MNAFERSNLTENLCFCEWSVRKIYRILTKRTYFHFKYIWQIIWYVLLFCILHVKIRVGRKIKQFRVNKPNAVISLRHRAIAARFECQIDGGALRHTLSDYTSLESSSLLWITVKYYIQAFSPGAHYVDQRACCWFDSRAYRTQINWYPNASRHTTSSPVPHA